MENLSQGTYNFKKTKIVPDLKTIAASVQQVAEAISHALNVETEIVDNELTIVGGTYIYKRRIWQKEEFGQVNGNYLYASVLREGNTVVVEDTSKEIFYDHLSSLGKTRELAEICTPIKTGEKIIGIIGLVAFEEDQRKRLMENKENMVHFVERMADLLGAKAYQDAALKQMQITKNEMATFLETIHEGMLAIDRSGYITCCNSNAENLLKSAREEIIGAHLYSVMPETPALKVIETGEGYVEQEEIFKVGDKHYHFIVTANPIEGKAKPWGVVVSFRDILEAEKLVYKMGQKDLKYTIDDIIGNSSMIEKVKQQALIVAKGNSTVLITGESGTGKEVFARAIHYSSSRKNGPFITVNCGAIPETLLESELFGYEKGAFTGAQARGKEGKFELADGGTIFLDEIGEMPLHLQVKLLHVLQNMRFERVGGTKTISVDIRIIAATNRDLEEMIREKEFREDLYYRLSVIPLKIPPLRERRDDISLLMNHFLNKYNMFMNKHIQSFSKQVHEIYEMYGWPGNVRELENAVEFGVNMTFGDEIGIDAVPPRVKKNYSNLNIEGLNLTLQEQMKKYEKEILAKKIAKYGNDQNAKLLIAKELDISRATLYRKLAEYNLS